MFLDYLIEYLETLVYTVAAFVAFGVLTSLLMPKFFKAHRKYFIKILKVVFVFVLIVNSLGFWFWVMQIGDAFVSSFPYLAIEWQEYYYLPVMDLGEVGAAFYAFALIQITVSFILSLWYLHLKHNNRNAVLALTTFFILQYLTLGIGSYLILFQF